ncbi:hypothetical protein LTR72_011884 [Exophiala xenobiotica]|nr:hypothetical protein LTR72_011884 [Exophiala xenobiotica]
MTITLYADELIRLTVDDIGDEEFFDIKDRENETEEHLAHLRKLYYERAERDRSRAVDANELGVRLECLPTTDSPIPSFTRHRSASTSTIDSEKDKEGAWQEQLEAYHDLVADGGRPSHPVTLGWDVIENPNNYEQYKDIIWFWHGAGGYYTVFFTQLMEWRRFREMQDKMRTYYIPKNRFQDYQDAVRESQADAGCTWDLRVLEDRHQQNQLEDWNEFRALYYLRLKECEKRVPPAHANFFDREKEFENVKARLTDVVTDPQILYGRFDDIQASEKEVSDAKSRLESAEKVLQAAKKRRSKRKAASIGMAHQELASARDNLMRITSDEEMRRLRAGYDLHIAHKVMLIAKGKLTGAELDVKRWKVFLKWIDDQYPAVAEECGCFARAASDFTPPAARGKKNPRNQKEQSQLQRRSRRQTRSVLSPNISPMVSKTSRLSKARVALSSLRATEPTLTTVLQKDESRVSLITSSPPGDDDHSRDSRPWPCLIKSTHEPLRRSARIAHRVKGLQNSNAPSEIVTDPDRNAHELSKVKRQKAKGLKGATKRRNSGKREVETDSYEEAERPHDERMKQFEALDRALPGKHTRKLYDKHKRDEAQILAQLRTGKNRLNSALYVIKAADLDQCEWCGPRERSETF